MTATATAATLASTGTGTGSRSSRAGTPPTVHCPDCGKTMQAPSLRRHRLTHRGGGRARVPSPAPAPLSADAARAYRRLQHALADLRDSGQQTPCAVVPEAWVSEDYDDRQVAAEWCDGCPLLGLCAAYADAAGERFGVWAGRDRC